MVSSSELDNEEAVTRRTRSSSSDRPPASGSLFIYLFICLFNIISYRKYKSQTAVHHPTCGISSLLRSVNIILFTLLLAHLILCISPHHSHHLCSHHLSLPRPFIPDLKLICFTNPFLHSLGSIWTAFTNFGPGPELMGTGVCLF